MEADNRFVKELKELDENLNVNWNNDKKRWLVTRKARKFRWTNNLNGQPILEAMDKDSHILTVENDDKSYRGLDNRIIDTLKESDSQRYDNMNDFFRMIEGYEDIYKVKKMHDNSNRIQELTKHNYRRLQDAIETSRGGRYGS